jgi:excinuclease ABC subunit A
MESTGRFMNGSSKDGPDFDEEGTIRIRGARVHNLQNVDVDIPRQRLVVITGPSGSGKSSLALDTLFAEGQRQYIESLSVYARQFLDQLERPDVDLIDGLQPTICIDQRPVAANPRSTVATVTEIYDYLRLLLARLGEPHCYQCGTPICQQTPDEIRDSLMELPLGTKLMLMAPQVRGRRGKHDDVFRDVRKAGFVRIRVDGEVMDIDDVPELEPRKPHNIEAVVDRIVIRENSEGRLAESIQLAVRHGEGLVVACYYDEGETGDGAGGVWRDRLFSTLYACPNCDISYEELEPRTFSFNSPYGACPQCHGLGWRTEFDPELVLPDLSLSLSGGAVAPWKGSTKRAAEKQRAALDDFVARSGFDWETPLNELNSKTLDRLLRGDGKKFLGLLTLLEKELATTTSAKRKQLLETFRGKVRCAACGGSRLRPEAASVLLGGKAIHEITALSVAEARTFFQGVKFPRKMKPVGDPLREQIGRRLEFLEKVGAEYLTLDRPADTLSGGELQRVRLATGIGSGLVGVCYVLDEPSIGLHPRDNQRLIDALRDLERLGNTVLVVEHDEAMMRQADELIDFGPGAGKHGGRIVAQGRPDALGGNGSLTGRYLAGELRIEAPARRRRMAKSRSISIEGVRTNNLQNVSPGRPGVRDGGQRVGQEFAGERDADAGPVATSGSHGAQARSACQPAGRRRNRQGDRNRPGADRPHAPQQRRHIHRRAGRNPQGVRRHARGAATGLSHQPLQLQRQERTLRGVPGAGGEEDRNELPAGPVRHLR